MNNLSLMPFVGQIMNIKGRKEGIFLMNHTKLNKYARSVSIIGVGCTPFMYTVDNPETNGLTEGEMFGYAALKAMEDAGITAKDVDFYFHGEASPLNGSNYLTPGVQIANWFGMKGKANIHHSEACCTGYLAIEEAANAVASANITVYSLAVSSSATALRHRPITWSHRNIRISVTR